jgi:hypothetical protein
VRRLALALCLSFLAACEDTSYREIGAQIRVLSERTDGLVPPALERLARFRRRALPQIEIALHTASATGKRNLIEALGKIADPESAAILRHFAIYDPAPEVRAACDELLDRWTRAGGTLAKAAKAARAKVSARRAAGEGPVVVGEATGK